MDKFKQSLAEKERARIANKGTESNNPSATNTKTNFLPSLILILINQVIQSFYVNRRKVF